MRAELVEAPIVPFDELRAHTYGLRVHSYELRAISHELKGRIAAGLPAHAIG